MNTGAAELDSDGHGPCLSVTPKEARSTRKAREIHPALILIRTSPVNPARSPKPTGPRSSERVGHGRAVHGRLRRAPDRRGSAPAGATALTSSACFTARSKATSCYVRAWAVLIRQGCRHSRLPVSHPPNPKSRWSRSVSLSGTTQTMQEPFPAVFGKVLPLSSTQSRVEGCYT